MTTAVPSPIEPLDRLTEEVKIYLAKKKIRA